MIGQYVFRPAMRLLHDQTNNRRISLTSKEADLLRFLYRLEGHPVKADVLLHEVWGYSRNAETHTLSTHIYRLRQKMESDPAHPVLLVSVGKGYRLEAGQRPLKLHDRTVAPDAMDRTHARQIAQFRADAACSGGGGMRHWKPDARQWSTQHRRPCLSRTNGHCQRTPLTVRSWLSSRDTSAVRTAGSSRVSHSCRSRSKAGRSIRCGHIPKRSRDNALDRRRTRRCNCPHIRP